MTDISNNPHTFAISEIGDDDVIIGLDWIKKINPIINWKQGYMRINNKQSKITYRSTRIQNKQITNEIPWKFDKKKRKWYNIKRRKWYTIAQVKQDTEWLDWFDKDDDDENKEYIKPEVKRKRAMTLPSMTVEYPINFKEEKDVHMRIYGKHFDKAMELEEIMQEKELERGKERYKELVEQNPWTRTRTNREEERNIPRGRKYVKPHMEPTGPWYNEHSEKVDTGIKRPPSNEIEKGEGIKRRHTEPITDDYRVARTMLGDKHANQPIAFLPNMSIAQKLSQMKAQREGRLIDGTKRNVKTLVPRVLWKYLSVFNENKAKRIPKFSKYDMEINIIPGKELPQMRKLYPIPHGQEKIMEEYIQENIDKGFIREPKEGSKAYTVAAPVFLIGKKDGGARMVIDYRELNKVTEPNTYPIPRMEKLRYQKNEVLYFTTLDLRNGYNNIRIKEGDEYKAAFRTPSGVYEPTVMFFGMKNSPAHFQRFMETIFRKIDPKKIKIYLDDILIPYGKTLEEHIEAVKEVLGVLQEHDLYCKPEKCYFFQKEVDYLGMKVSREGIAMDPDKVKAILEWPNCTNVRDIRKLMGFIGFYRQYIPNIGELTKKLTELIKKDVKFVWTEEHTSVLNKIKELFKNGAILMYPNFDKKFTLKTDASKYAIGAVLEQEDDKGRMRPVSFYSRGMTDAESNYKIFDKEMLAVIAALQHWKHLIFKPKIPLEIITDHSALQYFGTKQSLSERQIHWMEILSEYDYTIKHQPGKDAVIPDALSRRPDYKRKIDNTHIMIPKEKIQETPLKINKINNEITKEQLQEAIKQSQQKKNEQGVTHIEENHKNTKITNKHQIIQENNLLYMEDTRSGKRVQIIPWQDKELIATILQCYHDDEQAGHPGVKRTMELITRELYWKTMIQDVKQHIKECIKCQQNKPIRKKRTEITQAIQIPTRPWEIITYDLIGPLPLSNKYDGIMVIVDKHSKYLELLPIQMNYDNQQILKLLEDNIFKRYG